jgi:hypothetical protein
MRFFCFIFLVFASCNSQSQSQEIQGIDFPSQFHGVWDYSLEQCDKQLSTARVTINSEGIEYWESFGVISKVISQTKNSLHIILSMSGEEENWLVESEFRLEKEKLVDLFIDEGSSFTRVRCKGKTKQTKAAGH